MQTLNCHRRSFPLKATTAVVFAPAVLFFAGCSGTLGSSVTPPAPTPPAVTVSVTGSSQVRLGETTQFTAAVSGTANQAVVWQVNGVGGGSAATGTISSSGLYSAPTVLPTPNTATISAVSAAATTPGTLTETILNPVAVLNSATAAQVGSSSSYTVDALGSSFESGAQIEVGGSPVPTTIVSGTELTATVPVTSGATSVTVAVLNPEDGSQASASINVPIATLTSAARLLDQATFGPTLTDMQHVQQIGLDAYLTEQFATPQTVLADIPADPTVICTSTGLIPCEQSEWWQTALTAQDQLRQRVAFALSEMFVVSMDTVNPRSVITYQNTLARDAFGNFSTLMKDVTLSPAMGGYLNMLNSNKPAAGQIANENYPREFMQLFTTGIDLLNADGSLQLDANGDPIPVYTQTQVQAFARAYTGWTYANAAGGSATKFPNGTPNLDAPMAAVESAHDTTSKTLLNGTVLPAGQTAEQDLAGAISNIFNHPNVGPFVCRQLIQHLVASDPSPAYVARVAAVFADDGTGVRGNMQAVIRAILEDPEARAGDTEPNLDSGHLREAILYTTDVLRALNATNTSTAGDYSGLSNYTNALGQRPFLSPSVFNFFPPNYVLPGGTKNAPEFAQENTASAILRLTLADEIVNNHIGNFSIDLSATSPLGVIASKTGVASTDAGNLVDMLGKIFLHGQMPAAMRAAIVNHVATLSNIPERVRVATYLVVTSSQYKIEN